VPLGVVGLVDESVTMAVQGVGASTGTVFGRQETEVDVGVFVWLTVTLKGPLVLGDSIESPL
jgi:hypothetical protein